MKRPALYQSSIKLDIQQAILLCPSSQALSATLVRSPMSIALVACLLGPRRPIAILRSIRAIIVSALNRMLRRGAWTHIRQKCGKIVPPAAANSNSTSAITREAFCICVVTAPLHRLPNLIFRRRLSVQYGSMFQMYRMPFFGVQAPATLFRAATQIIRHTQRELSTITAAFPETLICYACLRYTYDDEAVKSPTCEILKWRHRLLILAPLVK